jgi:hypothetical protein
MTFPATADPLERLSRADRRRWRRLDRRARQVLEAQQLALIRRLAVSGAEVESVGPIDGSEWPACGVELTVGSRRLTGRMPKTARVALNAAVASGPVQLASAGRYGPYWTLTFAGRGAPLVVLMAHLSVSGPAGGAGDAASLPVEELVG